MYCRARSSGMRALESLPAALTVPCAIPIAVNVTSKQVWVVLDGPSEGFPLDPPFLLQSFHSILHLLSGKAEDLWELLHHQWHLSLTQSTRLCQKTYRSLCLVKLRWIVDLHIGSGHGGCHDHTCNGILVPL